PSPSLGSLCVPVKISTMMIKISRPVIPPMWHLAYGGLVRLRACRVNSPPGSGRGGGSCWRCAGDAAPALHQASPGLRNHPEAA
ncbi:MAG: hypothetical protein Q8S17_11720, partial [Humidesulfovibrio sp.]|nr:hypothetical protein [Humidesulfovibrio sp.]